MPTIISLCLYYSPGCKKNPIAYYYIAGNLQILSIFLKYSCFSGLNELQLSSRSHHETMIEFKDFQILSRTFRQYNDTLELYQLGDDSHLYSDATEKVLILHKMVQDKVYLCVLRYYILYVKTVFQQRPIGCEKNWYQWWESIPQLIQPPAGLQRCAVEVCHAIA